MQRHAQMLSTSAKTNQNSDLIFTNNPPVLNVLSNGLINIISWNVAKDAVGDFGLSAGRVEERKARFYRIARALKLMVAENKPVFIALQEAKTNVAAGEPDLVAIILAVLNDESNVIKCMWRVAKSHSVGAAVTLYAASVISEIVPPDGKLPKSYIKEDSKSGSSFEYNIFLYGERKINLVNVHAATDKTTDVKLFLLSKHRATGANYSIVVGDFNSHTHADVKNVNQCIYSSSLVVLDEYGNQTTINRNCERAQIIYLNNAEKASSNLNQARKSEVSLIDKNRYPHMPMPLWKKVVIGAAIGFGIVLGVASVVAGVVVSGGSLAVPLMPTIITVAAAIGLSGIPAAVTVVVAASAVGAVMGAIFGALIGGIQQCCTPLQRDDKRGNLHGSTVLASKQLHVSPRSFQSQRHTTTPDSARVAGNSAHLSPSLSATSAYTAPIVDVQSRRPRI